MNKKQLEQQAKERQKKKQIKIVCTAGIVLVIASLIIAAVVISSQSSGNDSTNSSSDNVESSEVVTNQISAELDEQGNLHVDKAQVSEGATFVDYGGDNELLVWIDSDGRYRAAFNLCEECYARNGHYELHDGVLQCSACGNGLELSSLQHGVWGGCQPVEFPDSGRTDTDTEIVILQETLTFADEMFEAWNNGNMEQTFENFNL